MGGEVVVGGGWRCGGAVVVGRRRGVWRWMGLGRRRQEVDCGVAVLTTATTGWVYRAMVVAD